MSEEQLSKAPDQQRIARRLAAPLALVAVLALGLGTLFGADEIVVEENLIYGRGGEVDLHLDLAHPKDGAGPFPALVFIHGGAWAGGERRAYRSLIEQAARKGYVAAQISYRLTQPDPETWKAKHPYPAQLHDCKCAIRWLRTVAEKYRIDPDRIGVTGGSAGGHLSLMVGFVDESQEMEGDSGHAGVSSRVQAVVNYCGPTELIEEYHAIEAVRPYLKALCGGDPESAADAYRTASPVSHLTKSAPPVLTLHGDQDDIVPVSQARLLDERMKQAGLAHDLLILEGQGHAIKGPVADAAFWKFFETHLRGRK